MLGVILLIVLRTALQHGIADVRARDLDPRIDIRVHGLQLVKIDRDLHAPELKAAAVVGNVGTHPVTEGLPLIVLHDVPHAPRTRAQRRERHKHQYTAQYYQGQAFEMCIRDRIMGLSYTGSSCLDVTRVSP